MRLLGSTRRASPNSRRISVATRGTSATALDMVPTRRTSDDSWSAATTPLPSSEGAATPPDAVSDGAAAGVGAG
eukprot:3750281-Rhodomonas_salina.1